MGRPILKNCGIKRESCDANPNRRLLISQGQSIDKLKIIFLLRLLSHNKEDTKWKNI